MRRATGVGIAITATVIVTVTVTAAESADTTTAVTAHPGRESAIMRDAGIRGVARTTDIVISDRATRPTMEMIVIMHTSADTATAEMRRTRLPRWRKSYRKSLRA